LKKVFVILSTFILVVAGILFYYNKDHRIPKQLFGIKLGHIYDLGNPEEKDYGNIPIKKFLGIQQSFSIGIHYYFQPMKSYEAFKYMERKKKPTDKYFKSSFRLYLIPTTSSIDANDPKIKEKKMDWEVSLIEWSDNTKKEYAAYYWALDLCKTFTEDLSVKPKISDVYENKLFSCSFISRKRVFKITSFPWATVSLGYKKEIDTAKHEAVEKIFRKIRADEIRPFK